MDEGVLRQRRNLVTICLAILLYIFSEGSLESILGIKITRPEVAEYFAWIGFFYFLWRYWIHSRGEVALLLLRAIVGIDTLGQIDNSGRRMGASLTIKNIDNVWTLIVNDHLRTGGGTENKEHRIPGLQTRAAFVKKLIRLSLTEAQFSNFVLPYIISIITLIVGITHVLCR